MDFKPGDLVKLKSGGPQMTVEKIGHVNREEAVFCTWFEKTELKRSQFAPAALNKF
jgi:uncharacterized protein YodC (DUF2158 family)